DRSVGARRQRSAYPRHLPGRAGARRGAGQEDRWRAKPPGPRPRLGGVWMTRREAMHAAPYRPGRVYPRGEPPARHFRTSVHVSPSSAAASWAPLRQLDAGLGHRGRIALVDVGAGRGDLLAQVLAAAEPGGARPEAGDGAAPRARAAPTARPEAGTGAAPRA